MRKIMYIACLLGLLTFSACGKTDSTNADNMNKQENATDNSMNDVQIEDKQEQSNNVLEPEEGQEDSPKEAQEETELLDYEIIKVAESVIDKTQYDILEDYEDEVQVSFIVRASDNWKQEKGMSSNGDIARLLFSVDVPGISQHIIHVDLLKDVEGMTAEYLSVAVPAEYVEALEMGFYSSEGHRVMSVELPEEVSDIPERYILRGECESYDGYVGQGYILYLEGNPYLMDYNMNLAHWGREVNDEYYEVPSEIELIPVDLSKKVTSDFTGLQLVLSDEARELVQEYLAQESGSEKLDMDKIRQEIKISSAEELHKGEFYDWSQVYIVSHIYDYSNVTDLESVDRELKFLLLHVLGTYRENTKLVYENGVDSFSISY